MNYILYNPKANNENNDLNLISVEADSAKLGVKKINLIGLDLPAFCAELTESDRVLICGGDGTLHHFANNAYGIEFPCPVLAFRSGTGNDFLNDIGQVGNDDAQAAAGGRRSAHFHSMPLSGLRAVSQGVKR